MNYDMLVENRKSAREYQDTPVNASLMDQILNYFKTECHSLFPEIKTDLLFFDTELREKLEGAAGYENFLIGAPHYMVLLSESVPHAERNAGYMMEDMVLKLTDLDLATCWLTFYDAEKVKEVLELKTDLKVAAIIAFGYGKKSQKQLHINIHSMSNISVQVKNRYLAPKKSVDSMVFLNTWGCKEGLDEKIDYYDDLLWKSFYSASLAPSYLNRQPYAFLLKDHHVYLIQTPDDYTDEANAELGLGIVMLHFSCIASRLIPSLSWTSADDTTDLNLPEGCRTVAVCTL